MRHERIAVDRHHLAVVRGTLDGLAKTHNGTGHHDEYTRMMLERIDGILIEWTETGESSDPYADLFPELKES